MDVIIDEAKKLNMKLWILDDSHFPTGFANGAAMKAEDGLRRQSIYIRIHKIKAGKKKPAPIGITGDIFIKQQLHPK